MDDNANRRRIRSSIGDLSEYGKRYKGKSVSRKKLQQIDSEEEEDEEEDDEDDGEDDDEEEDEDSDEDDDEDDEEEAQAVAAKIKKAAKESEEAENNINLMNSNRNEEVEKGKAVKNQLSNHY